MAVKYADVVVADNKGIQDYVLEEYGNSEFSDHCWLKPSRSCVDCCFLFALSSLVKFYAGGDAGVGAH